MRSGHDALRRALKRRLDEPAPSRREQPLSGTWPELVVADWLDRWGVGYVAQHRLLPGVTVDFWLPRERLVIECQGTWHHGDPQAQAGAVPAPRPSRKRRHDAALQAWCARAEVGYHEVWESDLRDCPGQALAALAARLGATDSAPDVGQPRCRVDLPGGGALIVAEGDLTLRPVAAMVNSTNSRLAHRGGVAGALVRRGGAVIQAQSDDWLRRWGPVATCGVATTDAGALPCRVVLHVVGPLWRGGGQGEAHDLRRTVRAALATTAALGHASVAMPVVGAGGAGLPAAVCATAIIDAATDAAVGALTIWVMDIDPAVIDCMAAEVDRRQI